MIENSRFTMIDQAFVCSICGKDVPPLKYTARNHCPYCLSSLHLDENPGDRMSHCKGVLKPLGIEMNKKGMQIIFKCGKCGTRKKNITAKDDNIEKIIELSTLGS